MTAVTTDHGPLWDEALDVLNRRAASDDENERKWLLGVNAGYAAALSDAECWAQILRQARSGYYTYAWPFEHVLPALRMLRLPPDELAETLYRSGVLRGYLLATADEPDADTCIRCEQRILLDRQAHIQCRYHGYLCSEDCRSMVCTGLCERNDDLTWFTP